MEVDAATPLPCPTGARISPEDYVAEEAFPRILELIGKSSSREAKRAVRWKREAGLQELLVGAISSGDEL
jgi:hypothetical protein